MLATTTEPGMLALGPAIDRLAAAFQAAAEPAGAADPPWNWIAVLTVVAGEVLAVVFVMRALARGGSPATTLIWVVVILAAPWIGILLYYLFPRRIQRRRLKRRIAKAERRRDAVGATGGGGGPTGAAVANESELLHRLLGRIAADALSYGNRIGWLPSGQAFFAAAAAAIRRASATIELEVYILRPDDTGLRLLELLTEAADRGVVVRLLFDSVGSWGLKGAHLAALRAAGGKAVAFQPLLWKRRPFTVNLRDHRKLLVVDGVVGFVGGRNVGDEYSTDRFGQQRTWHDAMVQVEGPAVAALRALFAENWYHAADEELAVDDFVVPPPAGDDCVAVVASGPDREVQELWFASFQALCSARDSIVMSSPYLVPPPTMFFALSVAAARGVRVRIYTNGQASEALVLYRAQRSYYAAMIAAGVEVYETARDYNHAKFLVVDERAVMVGSANTDMRSAQLNWEVAVAMPDSPALAAEVLRTLEERYAGAEPLRAEDLSLSLVSRAIDGLCRLFSPIL